MSCRAFASLNLHISKREKGTESGARADVQMQFVGARTAHWHGNLAARHGTARVSSHTTVVSWFRLCVYQSYALICPREDRRSTYRAAALSTISISSSVRVDF